MSKRTHFLYIGTTNDRARRVAEPKGDKLVCFEAYQDVRDAFAREKQLKGSKRAKKLSLIEALRPHGLN